MVEETEEQYKERIFEALSHPIRRKILSMIGSLELARYTDFKELGLEPGTLYFHIKYLMEYPPLIIQNKQKQYSLTDLGKFAYNLLSAVDKLDINLVKLPKFAESLKKSKALKFFNMLSLTPVLTILIEQPLRNLMELLIALIILGYILNTTGLTFLLLWVELFGIPFLYPFISVFLSLIGISAMALLMAKVLFKKLIPVKIILICSSFSLILFFPFVVTFLIVKLYFPSYNVVILTPLFLLEEVWSILFLSNAMYRTSDLTINEAILTSLVIGYISLLLHVLAISL